MMKWLLKRIDVYKRLTRLDKPVGILLLLWPTSWALIIAGEGAPTWDVTFVFVAGVVLMRSAGCVMNDIADRNFDGHVARTKERVIVSGEASVKEALLVAATLSFSAFILVCFLNKTTVLLSLPALLLAMSYPLAKRFIAIPQAYLGVAFGFGIPMAFAAIQNQIPMVAWLLLLANVFWAVAYDTEYAMVDREDDLKIGVKSSAIFFGRYDVIAIMACYVAMLGLLSYCAKILGLNDYFYLGLAVALVLIIWQHQMIKQRISSGCFKAFRMNHWIGCAVFLGLAAEYF